MDKHLTSVSIHEFNRHVDYYISCLFNALKLSIKRSKKYFLICKELYKKKVFRKKEFATLFNGPTRYVLQDIGNANIFIKGDMIGFVEKFYLANEIPTQRGRVVKPTDVGNIVSKVLNTVDKDLKEAKKVIMREFLNADEGIRNDVCFQGQLLNLASNEFIPNIPRNYIERELFKLFVPEYLYNNGHPIKLLPPFILRKGVEINESAIDKDSEWTIEIYFEVTPKPDHSVDLTSFRRNYLEGIFFSIRPFMISTYVDYMAEIGGVSVSCSDIAKVFNVEAHPELKLEIHNGDSVAIYYTIRAPSIRRCVKWLGL